MNRLFECKYGCHHLPQMHQESHRKGRKRDRKSMSEEDEESKKEKLEKVSEIFRFGHDEWMTE